MRGHRRSDPRRGASSHDCQRWFHRSRRWSGRLRGNTHFLATGSSASGNSPLGLSGCNWVVGSGSLLTGLRHVLTRDARSGSPCYSFRDWPHHGAVLSLPRAHAGEGRRPAVQSRTDLSWIAEILLIVSLFNRSGSWFRMIPNHRTRAQRLARIRRHWEPLSLAAMRWINLKCRSEGLLFGRNSILSVIISFQMRCGVQ
jgi:hypothetical protein